jgi:WD40 repeat protein
MMCMKKNDLYAKAKWDGAEGSSRQVLLDDLQGEKNLLSMSDISNLRLIPLVPPEFLPTGVIMPPQRLATLFDQARRFQESRCLYHSGSQAVSLLSDHRCQREVFPTVTTHVLVEHTDEVWTIEWSPNGQYLASAGKDMTIHIWKIEASRCWKAVPGGRLTYENITAATDQVLRKVCNSKRAYRCHFCSRMVARR